MSHMSNDLTTVQIRREDRRTLAGVADVIGEDSAHATLHYLLEDCVDIQSHTEDNPVTTGIIVEEYKNE